jgi:hypothetical protein
MQEYQERVDFKAILVIKFQTFLGYLRGFRRVVESSNLKAADHTTL